MFELRIINVQDLEWASKHKFTNQSAYSTVGIKLPDHKQGKLYLIVRDIAPAPAIPIRKAKAHLSVWNSKVLNWWSY